jgi:chlorite dismutase
MDSARVTFVASGSPGGKTDWLIDRISAIVGGPLATAPRLARHDGVWLDTPPASTWVVRGVRSNIRYTTGREQQRLVAAQAELGRPTSTCAALIPIDKSDAWWALAQDERRAIFEDTSRHIAIGAEYLPRIARRLYHGRDIGAAFHFLTWFEYAPEDVGAFDELVGRLRETEEWRYVTREVDIRLTRSG